MAGKIIFSSHFLYSSVFFRLVSFICSCPQSSLQFLLHVLHVQKLPSNPSFLFNVLSYLYLLPSFLTHSFSMPLIVRPVITPLLVAQQLLILEPAVIYI
jgi:hypothetical protein